MIVDELTGLLFGTSRTKKAATVAEDFPLDGAALSLGVDGDDVGHTAIVAS